MGQLVKELFAEVVQGKLGSAARRHLEKKLDDETVEKLSERVKEKLRTSGKEKVTRGDIVEVMLEEFGDDLDAKADKDISGLVDEFISRLLPAE